jgi:hypothetical protein
MGVVLGELQGGLFLGEGRSVEPVLEDGLHGSVRGAADPERPGARGFEALRAVAVAEA